MGLLSFSLFSKIFIGIGAVSAATSIPLSIVNKEDNRTTKLGGRDFAAKSDANNGENLNNNVRKEVTEELLRRSCQEAYKSDKENKLGVFYICPPNLSRDQLVGEDGSWGYLLFVKGESIVENSGNIGDISELLKKVLSITYEEEIKTQGGHITFKLEGETEDRKLSVDTGASWQYFGVSSSFKDMDTLLSSIYKVAS